MEGQIALLSDPAADERCKNLKSAIKDRLPWDELKPMLKSTSQTLLEKEDEDACNILHHAIKAGYTEVVHYLFLRGYFMELQQPSQIPYLHLACFYGHTVIIGILLKERPADFKKRLPANPYLPCTKETESKKCPVHIPLTELKYFSPLDLAAASRQIRSVQLLLNVGRPSPSMLESAVEQGSTECVQLLLEEDTSVTQTDINRAFKISLTRKLAGCLKLLVNRGVQVSEVLNTMNPYHVMYMYSSGYQLHQDRNEGMAECTEVLVQNGENVNVDYPCGSFPLYSLLHAMAEEMDYTQNTPPVHHMRALECLLKAGANPNLDEESLLDSRYNQTDIFFSFSLGRDPYTSALSALIVLMEQSTSWEGCQHWFTDCMQMILNYGGDPQIMNRYGDTPLHDIMKCLAMQHCDGHLKIDLGPMIKLLMKFGADPNEPSTNGILPVNYYFTLMLCLPNGTGKAETIFTDWCQFGVPKQVLSVLQYMNHDQLYVAHRMIMNQFYAATGDGFLRTVTEYVKSEMAEYVSQPRTLSFICSLHIWQAIDRKQSKIEELPIPKGLKKLVMSIFDS